MSGRVQGKVAFITGVGKGQGRSHALRLAEEGADIIGIDICHDLPDLPYTMASQDDLDSLEDEVRGLGRRVVLVQGDVGDRNAVVAAIDEGVARLGRLDVVVANAGIAALGDLPLSVYFRTINTDLVGVVNAFDAAYGHLADGASLIATGSVASFTPGTTDSSAAGPGGLAYSWAKRAVAQLVRDSALVMAPRRIRVNAVHPTNCDTDLLNNAGMYSLFRPDLEAPSRADALPAFETMQAMPIPYIEPVDVSNAVLFLASDESRYVTGLQLRVDGGAVIKKVPGFM